MKVRGTPWRRPKSLAAAIPDAREILFKRHPIKLVVADDVIAGRKHGHQRAIALLPRRSAIDVNRVDLKLGKIVRERGRHLITEMAPIADE